MTFQVITSTDEVRKLAAAGLLWQKYMLESGSSYSPAAGWFEDGSSGIRANVKHTEYGKNAPWQFYILLEG